MREFVLDYLRQIWRYRHFWCSLAKNDLRNRYRRSFLGIGWSLVRPLGMTVVFTLVFGKIFNLGAGDYVPYLFLGLTAWQFLTECIVMGCVCFEQGASYIKQQPLPLAVFSLRTVLATGFHALIAFILAVAITIYFKGMAHPVALLGALPGFVLLFLLGWFLATLCGIVHVHFPDTRHLLEISLQVLFYLTPIIYRPDTLAGRGRLLRVLELNPLTWVLEIIRRPIVEGQLPLARHFLLTVCFVSVIGFLSFYALKKLEKTLVFWV
jgi:lipopolysaccharide transport system permease protein